MNYYDYAVIFADEFKEDLRSKLDEFLEFEYSGDLKDIEKIRKEFKDFIVEEIYKVIELSGNSGIIFVEKDKCEFFYYKSDIPKVIGEYIEGVI